MTTEQRRYTRTALDVELTITAQRARLTARSKDISLGGIFVKTDRPPAPDTVVAIEVKLPDQKDVLVVSGVVRWVKDTEGMGVQFTALDNRLAHAITRYVATRPTPKPGKLHQQR
jgi:uncharacterized protein (TIGR02266 family)